MFQNEYQDPYYGGGGSSGGSSSGSSSTQPPDGGGGGSWWDAVAGVWRTVTNPVPRTVLP